MQGTYSIRKLLENDLKPQLYKQILHEIKSPLLQQSFIFTTDDQYNHQKKYQTNLLNPSQQYTNIYTSYQPSGREVIISKFQSNPIKKQDNKQKWKWKCCQQTVKDLKQQEIVIVPKYTRRKIFQQKSPQKNNSNKLQNKLWKKGVSVYKALSVLKQIQQNQAHRFLQVIANITQKLSKLQLYQKLLKDNIDAIYQTLAQNIKSQLQVNNYQKIYARLNINNLASLFSKIRKISFKKQQKLLSVEISDQIVQVISILEQTQEIIQQYVTQPNITQQLSSIYKYLLSQTHGKNLLEQIQSFIHSLNVYELDDKTCYLEYIWNKIKLQKISQQQFIKGLCKNYRIYRQQKLGYLQKLQSKGFSRNI